MILTSLKTNQLSEDIAAWYWGFLRTVGSRELEPTLSYFEDDASLQVNNRVPAYGHLAIGAELERYWDGIAGLKHEPINILGSDTQFSAEVLAHYTLSDGSTIVVPASGFVDRSASGLIQSLRLFADIRPVFNRA